MRNHLTARLALAAPPRSPRRGDGTPPVTTTTTTTPPQGGGEERLSRSEWEAHRRTQLSKEEVDKLVTRVVKLEGENKDLRRAAAPEGGRVLSKEEAAVYDAYTALGKPDEVKKRLETGDAAATELGTLKKRETLREVAAAVGYNPAVLEKLGGDLVFEFGAEVEVEGRKVKPVSVKDAQGKATPLSEYAKAHWDVFMPALTAKAEGGTTTTTTVPAPRPAPTGQVGGTATAAVTPEAVAAEKAQSSNYRF